MTGLQGRLGRTPLLPARNGPEQEGLVVVAQRGLPRPDEAPAVFRVEGTSAVARQLEEIGCLPRRDPDLVVRVGRTARSLGAQLGDGGRPLGGHQ